MTAEKSINRAHENALRSDPAGWVLSMGGLDLDHALITFLSTWHGWTSGEPDLTEIKAQILRTVEAMVALAKCENAIGEVLIEFCDPTSGSADFPRD